MNLLSRFTNVFLIIFSLVFLRPGFAQEEYVCIWRNPERTMSRIFPEAADYRTITRKITPEKLKRIEERLKEKLLPGQRVTYQYFELLGSQGNLLGYILAASQKGEYGAIEFVFGLDLSKKINGIYIQRARERDTEFKKIEFLGQFIGKRIEDADNMEMGKDIIAKETAGTKAVLLGIRKELISFEELVS